MFIRRKILMLTVMILMTRNIYANVIFDQVQPKSETILKDGEIIFDTSNRIEQLQKTTETKKKTSENKDIYRQKKVWFDPNDVTKISHMELETMQKILIANKRYETAKVAKDYLDAEVKYGVNAWFMIGIQIAEANDWTSNFAKTRNNAWGIGAFDSNPNNAARYETRRAGIMKLAEILKTSEAYIAGGNKSVTAIADSWCSGADYWIYKVNTQISKFKSLEGEV